MKICIVFPFDKNLGGGSAFLNSLKKNLIHEGKYENNAYHAEAIIFNLSPSNYFRNFFKLLVLKLFYKKKIIARIDGPIYLYRGKDIIYDKSFIRLINHLCDGIIFQSDWSKNKLINLGLSKNINSKIIYNGCDRSIFQYRKINNYKKIIISSWSNNLNKGFEFYRFLDKNLNSKEIIFVGNSPISFENIIDLGPKNKIELAQLIKYSDIYVTASKNDPCSNSLIEALSSGLLCFAYDSGGHPELIKNPNQLFKTPQELVDKLNQIINVEQPNRKDLDITHSTKNYIDFIFEIKKNNLKLIQLIILTMDYFKILTIRFKKKYFERK